MNLANRRNLATAIAAIGLKAEITGAGRTLEIELADDQDFDVFKDQVAAWGGYKTGYGAWVLRPNYTMRGPDVGYCHVASAYHW